MQRIDRQGNLHFKYQADGLNLQRISYLPYRDNLAELRMLSYAARVSMCALVVMMLEWEREACGKKPVVTISFSAAWTLSAKSLVVTAQIRTRAGRPPP